MYFSPFTRSLCLIASKTFLALAFSSLATGAIVLTDRNSTVYVDPNSSNGMSSWVVDGQNVLAQQWFWYRTGSDSREYSINTISTATTKVSNSDFDVGNERLQVTYSNSQITVQLTYRLTAGGLGTGTASIAETISIKNNSGSALSLSFYQYSDFNLSSNGDNVAVETDFRSATQTVAAGGLRIAETVITPASSLGEAALYSSTLSNLEDGDIDNLNGNLFAGPGDVTWALQWDFNLAASGSGSEIIISKVKHVSNIPEPELPLLSLIGGLGWMMMFRRRTA